MTATSRSSRDRPTEPAATVPVGQPRQLSNAQISDDTSTADRSTADVALAELLVEIRKVMFLPPTDPTRIAVMAAKRRVLKLVEALQARPS